MNKAKIEAAIKAKSAAKVFRMMSDEYATIAMIVERGGDPVSYIKSKAEACSIVTEQITKFFGGKTNPSE